MKKKYTIISFLLSVLFFMLGKLIDFKIFGSDIFDYPNGILYNELKLYIYIPIFFILISLLILFGVFNNYFISKDNKKEEYRIKLLERKNIENSNREKELIILQQKENEEKIQKEKEIEKENEKFKNIIFLSTIIVDLEKRTKDAGIILISAGNQFLFSIIITIITIFITSFVIAGSSNKFENGSIIPITLVGSVWSFILLISAIIKLKNAGKLLESKN